VELVPLDVLSAGILGHEFIESADFIETGRSRTRAEVQRGYGIGSKSLILSDSVVVPRGPEATAAHGAVAARPRRVSMTFHQAPSRASD
jgi:hypothetical protein